ncbi:MAG TPA: response regulator transcription factor [Candidatus Dormibacteraeota bacterium]|nr:response regulator transcription factor [Candidatus Dormibacteraeota bacterium]
MTTRVLIVDDQSLVRAGFRLILESQPDFAVVGEASDGEQAVGLARRHRPDVILMDIRMPRMDGLEATRQILENGMSQSRVVALTTFDLDEYVYAALKAGACGFLLKDVTPEQLIAAVRLVAAGDALLAPSITRRLIERYASRDARSELTPDLASLTDREVDVLRLMARGLGNPAIAEKLVVSEATVKTHVAHILDKLQVDNRVQAVVAAYESRLVVPGELPD